MLRGLARGLRHLVSVGERCLQLLGPSPTLGSLGPSHLWRHKSWLSLQGTPCVHVVAGTPHGEVRDILSLSVLKFLEGDEVGLLEKTVSEKLRLFVNLCEWVVLSWVKWRISNVVASCAHRMFSIPGR